MASSAPRIKRVTDPLDDRVKARLVGAVSYGSSGSEHSATVVEDDSPCLSELVHSFLEDDHDDAEQTGYTSDSDRVDSNLDISESIEIIVKSIAINNRDPYKNMLMAHVLKAMEIFSFFRTDKGMFRRKVMAYLRELGHDAAICKIKWSSSSSGGLTAGSYEFIDVVQSASLNSKTRYFIDLDFASEFEIARPTSEYSRLLQYLPRVFVGKNEELKKIIKVMSDSARRSLKSKELTLPPWRKNRYMQNKWFGPYRRTTNQIPASSTSLNPATIHPVNVVQCRYVGFDDAVNGRLFVRTR